MDRYKKFMLITGIFLIAITVVFLKIFVLNTKDVKNRSLIEKSKGELKSGSAEIKSGIGTIQPDHIVVKEFDFKLSESDKLIKDILLSSTDNKKIKGFFNFNDLILRFVSAVDNIAHEESPVKNLDFLEPFNKFIPEYKNGKYIISKKSYSRYDYFVTVFDSFSDKFLAETYLRSKKLIDKAYKKLGYGNTRFDDTLYEAMRVLLETPVIKGDIQLIKNVVSYKYANSNIESLNRVQKHFIRLGQKNMVKVKKKIIGISSLLGFKLKI